MNRYALHCQSLLAIGSENTRDTVTTNFKVVLLTAKPTCQFLATTNLQELFVLFEWPRALPVPPPFPPLSAPPPLTPYW